MDSVALGQGHCITRACTEMHLASGAAPIWDRLIDGYPYKDRLKIHRLDLACVNPQNQCSVNRALCS